MEAELIAANAAIQAEIVAKRESEKKYENKFNSLYQKVLNTIEFVTDAKVKEVNQPNFDKTIKLVGDMEKILEQTDSIYEQLVENKLLIDDVTQQTIFLGCAFITLHEQCLLIYNTTTDIGKGEGKDVKLQRICNYCKLFSISDIYNQINSVKDPLLTLFQQIKTIEDITRIKHSIVKSKQKLSVLHKSVTELNKTSNNHVELGDLVENELAEMDNAIEEAAKKFVELLSSARSKDEGIKLEVSEKILDACTFLMQCIKLLIRKAKALQEEIVSAGRGECKFWNKFVIFRLLRIK